MSKKIFLLFLFVVFLSGCSVLRHKDQLLTLKRLGDDQAQQEKFLLLQEKKFKLLLSDIDKDRLRKGTTRKKVLSRYGEPIAFKEIKDDPLLSEHMVYRHPEEFFGSEKVYLFFDKDSNLANWIYQPAPVSE